MTISQFGHTSPPSGHDISMLEPGSEVTASTTLSLSVFASLNPLTVL